MSAPFLKKMGWMLVILLLMAPLITSELIVEITPTRQAYLFGEPIEFRIESASGTPLKIEISDPNAEVTRLRDCTGTCGYSYMPKIVVQGEYRISASDGQSLRQAKVMVTERPMKPVQKVIPDNRSKPTEEYVFVDIEKEIGSGQEERTEPIISAVRNGTSARISVGTRNVGEKITITVTDQEGSVYVLQPPFDGESYTIDLYTNSSAIEIEFDGTTTHVEIQKPLEKNPEIRQSRIAEIISIKDSQGRDMSAKVRMVTKDRIIENASDLRTAGDVKEGRLDIDFDNLHVKKMAFRDVDRINVTGMALKVEDVPAEIKRGAKQAYAIDPTGMEFSEAEVTVTAEGEVLMKCKEYDFDTRICSGEWEYVMHITPGRNYTFILTPEDPIYAEMGVTYVLDDGWVASNAATTVYNTASLQIRDRAASRNRLYMRWDISGLPPDIKVTNAVLALYNRVDGTTASASVYHVLDDSWRGIRETTLTWNNQPCGLLVFNATACNAVAEVTINSNTGWKRYNVTKMMNVEEIREDGKLSLMIRTPETGNLGADVHDSSETAQLTRPQLNITYLLYPRVSLTTPANATTSYRNSVELNYSAWDDTTKLNCTLYGNFSGEWKANKTIINALNNTHRNFTISPRAGAYIWNVLCIDKTGLNKSASGNRTIIVKRPLLTANATTYLTVHTAGISGTTFPPNSNLTITFTDPLGDNVTGYPRTILTSGTGTFSRTWQVPVNAAGGIYTMAARQTNDSLVTASATFVVYALSVTPKRTDYVKDETMNLTAGRFTANADVIIRLTDPYLDPVSGYPKTVKANASGQINDSWHIPVDATLGDYQINVSESAVPARSRLGEFSVVNAVIETQYASYEPGEIVNISGFAWDALQNVTINITSSSGTIAYGPRNITANSSGMVNASFLVGYGLNPGDYTLSARSPSNPAKSNSFVFVINSRAVSALSQYPWYRTGDQLNITGLGFSPGGTVNLSITNSTGQIPGFPQQRTANSTGGWNRTITISGMNTGLYTLLAADISYPNLNTTSLFEVVKEDALPGKSSYATGEAVTIIGEYWDRMKDVTINVTNSTGHKVHLENTTVNSQGSFVYPFLAPVPKGSSETFNATIYEPGRDGWESFLFVVQYKASLNTNQSRYINNFTARITGNYYTPGGLVQLNIVSGKTKTNAEGYPKLISANATGGISHLWNTSDYCLGNYSVRSIDQTKPTLLYSEKNFSIVKDWRNTFFDGFESGSLLTYGWQEYEIQAGSITVTNVNVPKTGANHLEVRGLNNYVNLTIDLRKKSDANITFWWKGINMEAGEYVQLNIYDGVWHNNVKQWGDPRDTSVYYLENISLGQYNLSNKITIQFLAKMSTTTDYYYVDDFTIKTVNTTTCREFDSSRPNVTTVAATPSTGKIGRQVNISALIKDDRGIKEARARIISPDATTYNLSMTDHDSNSIYNLTFTSTAERGTYQATIFATDNSNNINNTQKTSFTIEYDTLAIATDRSSYIVTETAYLRGTGFDSYTDINISLHNASGHSLSGYPKIVESNITGGITDSWAIPASTNLGTLFFNATQLSIPARSAKTTMSVVAAVLTMDKISYEQGETSTITGYNWDPTENVTLNITSSGGTLIHGPINLTANSTGQFNTTWQAGYGLAVGTYRLYGFEPSNHMKYDSFTFEVSKRTATFESDHPWYKESETINLTGKGFAPGSEVSIVISNTSGILPGYPDTVTANSSGEINLSVVVTGYDLGNYSAYAEDTLYPNLNSTTWFMVAEASFSTNKATYGTGENITLTGSYWDRERNVTINMTNSTGHKVYIINATAGADGMLSHSFAAPVPNGTMESFTVRAYQDALDWDEKNVTVFLKATLTTKKTAYFPMALVDLAGDYFTPLDEARLTIKSLSNSGTAEGYPVLVSTGIAGSFSTVFNSSDYCSGSYVAMATDLLNPGVLQANATFSIAYDLESFQNAEVDYGRYMNWTWLPNRDSVACGNSAAHANYNLRGVFTLGPGNNSFFTGSWKESDDLPLAAGGSEEATITTNGGDRYNGMMMTSPTRVPANAMEISFWAYGYYLSGETNVCIAGNRYFGTANSTPNNDRAEYIGFAVWVDNDGDTMNNTNIDDDFIIFESHQSRIESGTVNFAVPEQTYYVDVEPFRGKRVYLTGTVTGTSTTDDALIQMDAVRFIFNSTGCRQFDIIKPNVTDINPANGSQSEIYEAVNVSARVTDDRTVILSRAMITYPNGSTINFTMTDPDKNKRYNVTFVPNILGDYQIRIYSQDNSTNVNTSERVTIKVRDTGAPSWSENKTSIQSGGQYNPFNTYQFNATWADNFRMGTVRIEHNFSGSMQNITVTANRSGEWYHTRGPIATGTYRITWYANDSSGNRNRTMPVSYTVTRNSSVIELKLNSTQENRTIQVHGAVLIEAEVLEGEKPVVIKINGTTIASGYPSASATRTFDRIGAYNITASHPGTRNYSGTMVTHWVHSNDTIAPEIIDVLPGNATYHGYNETLSFNATITDNFETDSAWLRVWNRFIEMFFGLIDIGGTYQANVTLNESFAGSVNYSISANDSMGNVKVGENWTIFVLGTVRAMTDRQSYIRGEVVQVNGTGFNLSVNITITIMNASEKMAGYPRNITSDRYGGANATWQIPIGQQLGTYSVHLNDTTSPRSASATFDIVTAVVEGQEDSFAQGDRIEISGYNWEPLTNVTMNITDSLAQVIYGPFNLTANSSGQINDSYQVSYGAALGSYRIYAESGEKSDYFTFSVTKRPVTLQTDERWYQKGDRVNLTGSGFSPGEEITITIRNTTTTLPGFPLNTTSNGSGHIANEWVVGEGTRQGYYNVTAIDSAYLNLNASTSFRTPRAEGRTDQASYNNGDTVRIAGSFWQRSGNVTIGITNRTGHMASGYPLNITSDGDGNISTTWTAYTNSLTGIRYNITFRSANDHTMNDTKSIIVLMAATLHTNREDYDQYETAQITGQYYTALGNVTLEIRNREYDALVPGYPRQVTSDGLGDIATSWNTRHYCEGNYSLISTDRTYPLFLNEETYFEIDYYDVTGTVETGDSVSYSGNYGGSGGAIINSRTSDNSYLWFGGVDTAANVNAWMSLNFDLSAIGIEPSQIMNLTFTTEYCHSGVQSNPVCTSGPAHDGETNGEQRIEAYNFTSGSWVRIGALSVDDLTVNEQTSLSRLYSGFTDLVSDDELRVRLEIDFNEMDSDDDMLVVDYAGVGIYYRTDVFRPCLEVRDFMENVTNITQLPGMEVSVKVDGSALDVKSDYEGLRNVTLYNGTTPLVRFEHDFNSSTLNLTSITMLFDNGSVAASVPGHAITLLVPLVNESCNVLVCEGVFDREGCDETNNRTVYGDPVSGLCEIEVNGTWAQDAPDKTDFLVTSADISLPEGEHIEGRTIYLNVTITNDGTTEVEDLTIEVYDKTHGERINITNITYMGPESEHTIRDIPWRAEIGNTTIEVRVDPFNKYGENDESNNNASRQVNVSIWQTYHGHVKSNLTIGSGLFSAYEWSVLNHTGNFYVAGDGVQIDWTRLQALGRTSVGGVAADDFLEADTALGTEDAYDSITRVFATDASTPKDTMTFQEVENEAITDVPIANSTNTTAFVTGILWDMSKDTDGEFSAADSEDLVFVTRINENSRGRFGVYDYEIRIPAPLREYNSATGEVLVYMSLD